MLLCVWRLSLCLDSAEIVICSSEENSYDHNDELSSYNRTLEKLAGMKHLRETEHLPL